VPRYVAFLRGINVGKRRLPMSQLKSAFQAMGFAEVSTFIASGNVIFSSKKSPEAIEAIIEKHFEASLGYAVDTFVRSVDRVIAIADFEPFQGGTAAENVESGTVHVGFFKSPLPPDLARGLGQIRTEVDKFSVNESEFYWYSQVGVSQSKVWALPEMRGLHLPTSTMRNMTSLRKLIAGHLT